MIFGGLREVSKWIMFPTVPFLWIHLDQFDLVHLHLCLIQWLYYFLDLHLCKSATRIMGWELMPRNILVSWTAISDMDLPEGMIKNVIVCGCGKVNFGAPSAVCMGIWIFCANMSACSMSPVPEYLEERYIKNCFHVAITISNKKDLLIPLPSRGGVLLSSITFTTHV